MYSPEQFNNTKNNPIYRSSSAPENDDHLHSDEETDNGEFSVSNIQISPAALMNMCPALLVQIEQGSCTEMPAPAPSPEPFQETVTPRHESESKEITAFGKFYARTFNELTLKV